jgi:hypothetical protein
MRESDSQHRSESKCLHPPHVFVNFAARLDPVSDGRRRRLEKAHRLSAPRLLAVVLVDYETRFLAQLSDAERTAYLGGADLNTSRPAAPAW